MKNTLLKLPTYIKHIQFLLESVHIVEYLYCIMHTNLNSKFPGEIFENSQADANCHKPYVPYRGNMNDSSSIKLESILPKSPAPPIIGIQANGNNAIASKLQVNNIINAPRINTKTIDNPSNLLPKYLIFVGYN